MSESLTQTDAAESETTPTTLDELSKSESFGNSSSRWAGNTV